MREQTTGVDRFGGRRGLRWLGVAGWEVLFDGRRVLVDPYLSRLLDRHLGERPELVPATHGHYDHLLEIPYVVRKHGSRVIGTC